MDTLRTRRPVYTPRTGFVWPISDAAASLEESKKRDGEEEESAAPTETAETEELIDGAERASVYTRRVVGR